MNDTTVLREIHPDDDLRSDYEALYEAEEKASVRSWLYDGQEEETVLPEILITPDGEPEPEIDESGAAIDLGGGGGGGGGVAPADSGGSILDAVTDAVTTAVPAIIKDVGKGGTEAIPQAFGGFVDALGEVDQFLQSVLPIGGMTLFDKDGNFDPSLISNEEMQAIEQAGDTLFDMVATDKADSVTGGIVRAGAQFLTGFLPGASAARAMGLGGMAAAFAGGAIADAVVFDPHEDRLSTFLNEVPALEAIVPDYLAETGAENQTEWEGRLKNAIEGAGLGALAEGLIKSFKYYKAQRQIAPVEDPAGAQGAAARDERQAAAKAEIENQVTDEMFAPLGDMSPDAPLLVPSRTGETFTQATKRIKEAESRVALMAERGGALERIEEIVTARTARDVDAGRGVPAGETAREPIDDILDQLRGNKAGPKMPARPVATIVRGLGGVDPASSLAGDLRSRGITPRSFPGLFRKGGLDSLDNIPASEHALFVDRSGPDGYIPEQSFIDGLEEELKGNPWRTAEEQALIDDVIAPLEDMEEQLSRLGINYENMSNDAVKARIRAIEEEQAAEDVYLESIRARSGEDGQPRTYADLADEQREIWSVEEIADARAAGVDPAIIAMHEPPKVFVNMARINAPEDVRALIQTMADADEAAILGKTRGTVSNRQTIKESDKEYKDLDDLIGRAPGPMSAAEAVAARKILASSAEQVRELAKVAASPNAGKVDEYNFRRAISVHAAIQAEVIGARTETARALQSWAIPVGSSQARTDAITDLLREGRGGDLKRLASSISNIGDEGINQLARDTVKMKTVDAIYSVWVNMILSGPKTHLVNIMSNAAVSMYAIPERYVAELGSNAFGKGDIPRGEAKALAFGMVQGMKDGFRLAVSGPNAAGVEDLAKLWDQFGKVDVRPQPLSGAAFELDPNTALYKGLDLVGKVTNVPGTMLERGDLFFKSVNYRMELNALAYREAKLQGLEGEAFAKKVSEILLNPPASIHEQANKMAAINTFTNPLGPAGQAVQKAVRETEMRWVVPFIRTPTNLMKFSFMRSPLALMSSSYKADIAAGGARAAQARARMGLGTAVMFTAAGYAMEGHITGGGPLDPAMNAAWRKAGNVPYSAKIGDKWYAYNRLDPLGMMIGFSADVATITSAPTGEADATELVAAGVIALSSNLASKTYAQNLFEFFAAIDGRNPSSDPGKYLQRFGGSLIPAFVRQGTQAMDPVLRETRDTQVNPDGSTDNVGTYLQGMVNQWKRQIPGLSDELPPVRDIFGDEINMSSGAGFMWDAIVPIATKSIETNRVAQEVLDQQVPINRISDVVSGVKLTAQEYDRLQQIAGPMLEEQLGRLFQRGGYKNGTDGPNGSKSESIRTVRNKVYEAARGQIERETPALKDRIKGSQRVRRNNLRGTN